MRTDRQNQSTRKSNITESISMDLSKREKSQKSDLFPSKRGVLKATCTANNTHITVQLVLQSGNARQEHGSTGRVGFKGTKRGTPLAAETLVARMVRFLGEARVETCDVILSGTGRGRNVIVKAVAASGRKVGNITEATKEPHNGCRPKKARRV